MPNKLGNSVSLEKNQTEDHLKLSLRMAGHLGCVTMKQMTGGVLLQGGQEGSQARCRQGRRPNIAEAYQIDVGVHIRYNFPGSKNTCGRDFL